MAPLRLHAQERDVKFEHLSLDQGLSQGSVYAVYQDQKGFMWFGTEDGLNRYDGYRFKVYKHDAADSTTLGNNTIYTLYEDREGVLWIGTWEGGLNRYDREKERFVRYQHVPEDSTSISHNTVNAIIEDREGALWIGTDGGGLNRFDRATGTFTRYQHNADDSTSLSSNWVYTIHEDRAGALWIGTWEGSLDRLDRATGTFTHYRHDPRNPNSLSGDVVTAICEDGEGALWVGTWEGGLSRLDQTQAERLVEGTTYTFSHYRHDANDPTSLSNDKINEIYVDQQGALWIGTDGGGLNRYDRETDSFTRFQHDPLNPYSLSYNLIVSLFEDRAGTLWIGTEGNGIDKIDRTAKPFVHYKNNPLDKNSLSTNSMLSFYEDQAGVLWIGTWGGGLNRLDRATGTFTHYRHDPRNPNSLSSDIVYSILEDQEGFLWIATEDQGLNRLNRETGAFTHYRHDPDDPQSLNTDYTLSLYVDRAGTLWVGTWDGSLNRYNRETDTFTSYQHDPGDPNSLSGGRIYALHEDREGTLWVGVERSGLNRFDRETGTFKRYQHDPDEPRSLSNNDIMSIYEDRAGTLWVGTFGGGLNRFDRSTETFRHYSEKDGLPNNVIYGILEDALGFLWMSTNMGISRFDPRTETFRNYDAKDGLQSNEFNSGASYKSRRGEMFFGGEQGFNAFFPEQIKDNPFVPPIVLTSFKKFNKEVNLDIAISELREITIDHTENLFSFEFAALNYSVPEKNQYRYRLEGLHDQWIDLGTKHDVTFTNLDPRAYILRIKGSNNDGVWNEDGLTIRVIIPPPFWKTRWFQGLAVLAVLFSFLTLYQIRTRSIRNSNKLLEDVNVELNKHITERKLAEADREHFIAELEAKNAELERFTYTVSHDLKSPLVTIKGFLGLLEQDATQGHTERIKHDIQQISTAADKMHRLLGELLELSRIGRLMNPPEAVPLTDLAHEAAEMVGGRIAERGVVVTIAPQMPTVVGDRMRLLEVYQNLIDNAVKFIGHQTTPCIEIGARLNGENVVCHVQDNGIG
ncbi:MAG: two-component regulator propeller domain-containing protein, partial [Rhodothermales bacterium]